MAASTMDHDGRDASGGYRVTRRGAVNPKHLCPICQLLMKNPLQSSRCQLACKSCYEEVKGNADICPLDNEAITKEEIFLDKCQGRAILQLMCRCIYEKYGCSWEGRVIEFEIHGENCHFKPIYLSLIHI